MLLNLLIAVMGDTFDRVKADEEAAYLQKQAQHIDALEAELSQAEAKQIKYYNKSLRENRSES